MSQQYVLVGRRRSMTKVLGPFDEPDDAREFANGLGMSDMVKFEVLPLMDPAGPD